MKIIIRFVVLAWILSCPFFVSASFAAQGPAAAPPGYASDQVLVKYRAGTADADIAVVERRYGLTRMKALPKIGVHNLRVVPGTDMEKLLRTLQENPLVEYAEPNHGVALFSESGATGIDAAIERKYGRLSVTDRAGVRRIAIADPKPQPGAARAVADALLRDMGSLLKDDPADLRFMEVSESLSGRHVRYQQTYAGIPVHGATTSVHLDKAGAVRSIQHVAHRGIVAPTKPKLSAAEALSIAAKNVPGSDVTEQEASEMRLYNQDGVWHLVWRVRIQTGTPPGAWELTVDAVDGSVLQRRSRMANVSGAGNVFNPNPTRRAAALGMAAPTHGTDTCPTQYPSNATNLTPFVETFGFAGLDGSGRLQGPAVKIVNTRYDGVAESASPNYAALTSVANSTAGQFFYPYNDASGRFEEVMSYSHVQKYNERLMSSLGYASSGLLRNVQTIVDVHKVNGQGQAMVGAATTPPNLIFLGDQHSLVNLRCREMAEEGDALIHEYAGHVMYANIHPQSFYENPGMEEGWADFLMASYFDDPVVGEWSDEINGVGYRRNLQNSLTLLNWQNECGFGVNTAAAHANGQIWSGALWRIRENLMTQFAVGGISRANVALLMDRLAIEGIYLFPAPVYGQNCDGSQVYLGRDALLSALSSLQALSPADPGYDARYLQVNPDMLIDVFSAANIGLRFPNDAYFANPAAEQYYPWTLHHPVQFPGLEDADIDAPEAWSLQTGRADVIVAIVDSGVNYTHEDLGFEDANLNGVLDPGEDRNANGVLDSGNMWPKLGWDYADNDNNPDDKNAIFGLSHGTRVAGVVGAIGNNGLGASGINWKISLMALRAGIVADSTAQAIDFATDNKALEINGSWGIWPWYAHNQTVADAVKRASDKNLLMVMAAGNTNQTDGLGVPLNADNDLKPIYPQSEVLPNVINVTATDGYDQQYERYGKYTVDLAAPTGLIGPSYLPSGYVALGQTSGAAPHVTGAIALLLAEEKDRIDANPGYRKMTMGEVRYLLLTSVDPLPSLKGKCVSEGRLNAYRLLINYTDSDLDGYADRIEALFGTDPRSAASRPDLNGDADGDGLSNALELGYGTIPVPLTAGADLRGKIYPIYLDANGRLLTGFMPKDTDGDGAGDFEESIGARGYITDPANPDTDGDGVKDGTDTTPSLMPVPAPVVLSATPRNGTGNVPTNITLTVSFSRVMDPATINPTTISMMQGFGGSVGPMSVTCNSPCTKATLITATPLSNSNLYTIFVYSGATGVKSAQGVPMTEDFTSSFYTASATAPNITGFWPGAGAVNTFVFVFGSNFVPLQTTIKVNNVSAPIVQGIDSTLLGFLLPTGNTAGPISVTTPQGSAVSSASFGIPLAGVNVTGIWPGSVKPGTIVFVFGSGFVPLPGQTTAKINNVAAPILQAIDPSLLFFLVPSGASTGPVTISTPTGSATSTVNLVVTP